METCCLPTLAQDLGRSAGSTPWVDHDGPGKYAANQLSKTHGKTMGKPWENGKSWENGKPWDFPWENPWQNPSFSVTFMKIHGKIHEKSIKNPSFS